MRKIPTSLILGDVRWERSDTFESLGGSGATLAYRLAELGHTPHLAARIGCEALGARACEFLELGGVDLSLIQRDPSMGTATIACEISSEGKLSSVRVPSEGSMDIGVTPELIATAENADMLYFSSFMQGGRSSGAALRYILERTGPSFKIYDIECRVRLPTRDELVSGLSVASLVYTRGEDLPLLCELLGLPDLEPGLFASAITERFGPSYCVVADPYAGALISSIVGEQVGLDQVRESTVDIRGWHEAFLAALIHHIFGGSSLSTCCAAGMRYGDVVAALPGSMTKVHPTELMLVASSGT